MSTTLIVIFATAIFNYQICSGIMEFRGFAKANIALSGGKWYYWHKKSTALWQAADVRFM